MSGPAVFTIPAGENFVAALARRLIVETAAEPLALAEHLVLLPTRRACRALRDAFLAEARGRPLILPRLRPLGDADEDGLPFDDAAALALRPAVPPLRRQLLLARLVLRMGGVRGGRAPTVEQAALLAEELARLLDQVETEGLDFGRLADLVPAELAEHWQITVRFLDILTRHWPRILAEEGFLDPAERRNRLLAALAESWEAAPPSYPIIAAGSTGSIPATARLLRVVAGLPAGRLVLPGLDRRIGEDARRAARNDDAHPQHGLLRLLEGLGVAPAMVPLWPGCADDGPRARLIAEVMRPAAVSDAWRALAGSDPAPAMAGVVRLDCPGGREEATAIALMLRETLEHPGRTAALVTPDRDLARRVAAELGRFEIAIDDSAGRPLAATMPGSFLLLSAEMVASRFAPHATLAALKHPLAAGGLAPGVFRARVRSLERAALRGPRPAPGVAGLRAATTETPALDSWLAGLERMAAPLARLAEAAAPPLADLLSAHVAFAEALAGDNSATGAARLWAGEAGEATASFIDELASAADVLPPLAGHAYPGLLRGLMAGRVARSAWGSHPRLAIWGPLEARLQYADLMILGGLNEGVWPPAAAADPWMSRPMRKDFGLPAAERRVGLSAHDFAQAFCAPRVALTRASKADGAPTVPSRWLLRLDAVLAACDAGASPQAGGAPWVAWAQRLDHAPRRRRPRPPAPVPPLEARPRSLSVTAVELWRRDPYAFYARHILRLRELKPIDADPEAADYGSIVHRILDSFLRRHPSGPLPADAVAEIVALGDDAFAQESVSPGVRAFWQPRFSRAAAWFIAEEAARRPAVERCWTEVGGRLELSAPAGLFTLTAKADRIDRLTDGRLVIIDYKTGALPTVNEVVHGYAPQLPLEAAIARAGGFADIPAAPVEELLFWKFRGGDPGGEQRPAGGSKHDAASLAEEALRGLEAWVAAFDDPSCAYPSRPHPAMAPRMGDYDHLARLREWAAGDDGDEGP